MKTFIQGILAGLVLVIFGLGVAYASHSADLNGDGKVDTADLAVLKSQWKGTGIADLNHDGTVNAKDAGMLFSSWGLTPPPPPPGTRDPAWWPFTSASIWNRPLGSGAVYTDETSVGWDVTTGGYANLEWFTLVTYVAKDTDPLRKIYKRDYWGTYDGTYFDIDPTNPGTLWGEIRIPDAAVPSRGTDGQLLIVSPDRTKVHELYAADRLPSGDFSVYGTISVNDPRSDGHSKWGGTVAAQVASMATVIRKGELISGSGGLNTGIRHALDGILTPQALNNVDLPGSVCAPDNWRACVWPANSSDPPTGYASTGNVWMGTLVAIPSWVDINAIGITDPQALEIARAMQDFGIYIRDTGGTGTRLVIRIDTQAASDIQNRTAFNSGLNIAMKYLKVVTNAHSNGGKPAWYADPTQGVGGGTPRRPMAPPL